MDTLEFINKIELLYLGWGNIIVLLSSFIETLPIGFIIPGGLIIALGGFYSFGEKFLLVKTVIWGSLGMLLAFYIGYFAGRKTGYKLVKKFKQEKNAEMAELLLNNHGPIILTTSLLANLTRFWISYVAGIQKYNIYRFTFYALIASLTWNSLFAVMGFLAGSERNRLEYGLAKLGILSYGIVLLALAVITWSVKKEYKLLKEK